MEATVAHDGYMPGFRSAAIFLHEHAFCVIDALQPSAGVVHGFTDNSMDRTEGRTEGVFEDVGARVTCDDFFRFKAVSRDV